MTLPRAGSWDCTLIAAERAAEQLEPHARDLLGLQVLGMITFTASLAAASIQCGDTARHWLHEATALAARLQDTPMANWQSFSTTNVSIWRVSVGIERGEVGGAVLKLAEPVTLDRLEPKSSRRADFFADVGRSLSRDPRTHGGLDQVVIGMSGTSVRLADTVGEVVTVTVTVPGLLADGDFAVLGPRPRPGMPRVSLLGDLPAGSVAAARWWERHIVDVLTGLPPDAAEGTVPRAEYGPGSVALTRREQTKAAELTAGHPVTANAVTKRRRRYQEHGLAGMVDYRVRRRMPSHGRADAAVVAAMRKAVGEAADDSTRTAAFVFRRTRETSPGTAARREGCRRSGPFTACSAGWRRDATRPDRRGPAGRWPPVPRDRSAGCRQRRPAT